MIGELFAGLAALAFGISGAAVAKGALTGRGHGDNGAFLSVLVTFAFAFVLWLVLGSEGLLRPWDEGMWQGVALFLVAGLLSTVLGRLTMFSAVANAGVIAAGLLRRLTPLFASALAFLVLGEAISLTTAVGMAAVMLSILAVVARKGPASRNGAGTGAARPRLGQAMGALSAFSYACSFVVRKIAMTAVPDALLGTFVGAVAALGWYAAMALRPGRYRAAVLGLRRGTGRWQVLAAFSMSIGQVLQFLALHNADIAVVSIIGSLEVFVSAWLAAYVLRTERPPDRTTIVAACVATAGVALIVLG